jgi:hypothetical protein
VVAVRCLELRDLLDLLGDIYRQCQHRVPLLLPIGWRSPTSVDASAKSGIAPDGLTCRVATTGALRVAQLRLDQQLAPDELGVRDAEQVGHAPHHRLLVHV